MDVQMDIFKWWVRWTDLHAITWRVCFPTFKLIRSLYGLKQAPKQWHEKFDSVMMTNGFRINECDKCVYVKSMRMTMSLCAMYVDDMLVIGSNILEIFQTNMQSTIHNGIWIYSFRQDWKRSIMTSKFLKDIPIWSKSMPAICIHSDSQITIRRTRYIMYNGN